LLKTQNPAASKASSAVHTATDGRVWYACGHSICVWDGSDVTVLGPKEGVPETYWSWIGETPQGDIAIRGNDRLLELQANPEKAGILRVHAEHVADTKLRGGGIPIFDHNGRMLVPTLEGLAIQDAEERWKYIGSAQGLLTDAVSNVLEDRE